MGRGRPRKIENMFNPDKVPKTKNNSYTQGNAGYDNSRDVIDPHIVTKVVDSKEGTVQHTPTDAKDIVNKEYVDAKVEGLWEVDATTNCTQLIVADEVNIQDRFFYLDTAKAVGLVAVGGSIQVDLGAGETLDMNTHKIECVVDPTVDQDAATKKYVDDQFPVTHASTTGQTTDDHHNETHNINSHTMGDNKIIHTKTAGAITEIGLGASGTYLKSAGDNADMTFSTITHAETTGQGTDDHHVEFVAATHAAIGDGAPHHAESHSIASHNDTTGTGAELDDLTDGSDADLLHAHAINDAKDTNVTTNLSLGAIDATTMVVASSDGTDATLIEADTTDAGLLGSDKWDEIVANTAAKHAEAHSVASHNDTSATGAELNTLTDNSMADTLHRHSELSASDGTPDAVVQVGATGNVEVTNSDLNSFGPLKVINANAGVSSQAGIAYNNGEAINARMGLAGVNRVTYVNLKANTLNSYTDNTAGMSFLVDAAGPISFATNAAERMVIDSSGRMIFYNMPTSDPSIAGALWSDSGTIKISAG